MPPGSYCTFNDNFCSWFNYEETNSNGQWIHFANATGFGYLGVVFKGFHKFALFSHLKSPQFDEIPLYHSIVSSKYFKSCKVWLVNYNSFIHQFQGKLFHFLNFF